MTSLCMNWHCIEFPCTGSVPSARVQHMLSPGFRHCQANACECDCGADLHDEQESISNRLSCHQSPGWDNVRLTMCMTTFPWQKRQRATALLGIDHRSCRHGCPCHLCWPCTGPGAAEGGAEGGSPAAGRGGEYPRHGASRQCDHAPRRHDEA